MIDAGSVEAEALSFHAFYVNPGSVIESTVCELAGVSIKSSLDLYAAVTKNPKALFFRVFCGSISSESAA